MGRINIHRIIIPETDSKDGLVSDTNYSLESDMAEELVHEAFLYLKLKDGGDIDPLTKGDEFGAGFS